MIRLLVLGLLLGTSLPSFAAVSAVFTPRLEDIQGKDALARRGILRTKVNGDWGPYSFYLEAFGEGETIAEQRELRRLGSGVFLQEAYVEFKLQSFYLRAGKQALRWSEMWVTPSLDVWTARRWNRFLYDPQPEQFEHSGGVSATYAVDGFSVEGAVMAEPARSRFPEPLPEFIEPQSDDVSGGLRVKFDLAGAGFSLVGARAGMKDTVGVSANYAFESFVPKIEIGSVKDRSPILVGLENNRFVAVGVDIFLGEWTFQPQATWSGFDGPDYQALFYLSGTWQKDRHDLQFQTFGNSITHDFFFNLFYAYNWKDWLQTGVFVQDYDGKDGGLFDVYRRATGGWLAGVRLEFNIGLGTE